MADVLELRAGGQAAAPPPVPLRPGVQPDEAAARRSLREQIARLESELGALFCSTYPRKGFDWNVRARGGPRLLPVRELEELHRRRIEEMLLHPEEHKWVRIQNEDIGEPGCKEWHVRPRYGLLGMLMNWWRVRISSGCPLAGGG